MGPHQALASAASASKEGSQEYVRAIIDAAAKLQPLLVRAAALRAAREPLAVRNEGVCEGGCCWVRVQAALTACCLGLLGLHCYLRDYHALMKI